MSSNRQYPIPNYAVWTIVAIAVIAAAVMIFSGSDWKPAIASASSGQLVQNPNDYDLRPCINQYTGTYAYFKTDVIYSASFVLTFVNQSGDLITQYASGGSVYETYVYKADF